jgi:hypothetical protein
MVFLFWIMGFLSETGEPTKTTHRIVVGIVILWFTSFMALVTTHSQAGAGLDENLRKLRLRHIFEPNTKLYDRRGLGSSTIKISGELGKLGSIAIACDVFAGLQV